MVAFKPTDNVKLRCNTFNLMDLLNVIHLTAQKGHFFVSSIENVWNLHGIL